MCCEVFECTGCEAAHLPPMPDRLRSSRQLLQPPPAYNFEGMCCAAGMSRFSGSCEHRCPGIRCNSAGQSIYLVERNSSETCQYLLLVPPRWPTILRPQHWAASWELYCLRPTRRTPPTRQPCSRRGRLIELTFLHVGGQPFLRACNGVPQHGGVYLPLNGRFRILGRGYRTGKDSYCRETPSQSFLCMTPVLQRASLINAAISSAASWSMQKRTCMVSSQFDTRSFGAPPTNPRPSGTADWGSIFGILDLHSPEGIKTVKPQSMSQ